MNILIINHYAGSPRHGMEHRPYMLAHQWTKSGHSVTIAAASYSHLRHSNPAAERAVSVETIDGIRYVWLRTPTYQGNGLRRVASIAAFVSRLYRNAAVLLDPRPDVVIASSTYPFDVLPARRLAAASNARFVYEVHDLWPLTPRELGHYARWHPYILAAQWAEDRGYRAADAVISLLPGTLPYMESHGLSPKRFRWIPNGVAFGREAEGESRGALPAHHRTLLERLRNANTFVVGYAGGHSLSNALDTLLDAAALTSGENIAYVLLGDGPRKAHLEARAHAQSLSNVHFLSRVGADAVPEFLGSVDIGFLGWHASPLYRFGISPNKLLDYMAARLPIVHAVSAYNDPVAESGCGVSVPPGDAAAIARAIRRLRDMGAGERRRMGELGRRFLEENHDYAVLARRFLEFVTARAS